MLQRFTLISSHHRRAITCGFLYALLLCANMPAQAQTTKPDQSDASKLQGQVVHIENIPSANGDKNSQGEVSFSSLSQEGIGTGIKVPVMPGKGDDEKGKGLNGKAETASLDIPLPGKRLDAKAEEAVSTAETGVDWSAWFNSLADRWFQNLKNMELRSGKTYHTVRPALIKFTCHRNGLIGGIVLRQSCGDSRYDTMQIESLKRVTPLPPFPEGSKRVSYTLLQGWEAHPRKVGEKDFQLGSFGKKMPIERVKLHSKIH